jgi:A/G-specific adenine glycosylase
MEDWFSGGLIAWYKRHQRDLPWRREQDPYRIWLSEIILQQTQVSQGLSYYQKFISRYPTVNDLASATEDEVMKLWQGLGYYSRARNLHHTAKAVDAVGGQFPKTWKGLKTLKGVGDYTAAAIASFSYDLPHAVVDGNVYRLLSRVFGIQEPIDLPRSKKLFTKLAEDLLDRKNPGLNNQAIMEFGSQHCKPVNPLCLTCIFNERCAALRQNKVKELPLKSKKIQIKSRYFNYVIVADNKGKVLLNKRNGSDIWKGMYEFSLIETSKNIRSSTLINSEDFQKLCGKEFKVLHRSNYYKHVLTHQHLHTRFYVVETKAAFPKKAVTCDPTQLYQFAFPRLIEKFLQDCDLREIL